MRLTRAQILLLGTGAMVLALVFGVRMSLALFISPLNRATGLGSTSCRP